jgi:predicted nucleotidyltransferase component of viral defense system
VIRHADIVARVAEWQLSHAVIEKDYVLGWLLWGIGSDPTLRDAWVFKGGTCLKKCYFETYRFSEDLDFTILPGGPVTPEHVLPVLEGILARVAEASGIDFSVRAPMVRTRPNGTSAEGAVYYRGPLAAPMAARIKLDLTADEPVVRPPVLRTITHPYPDPLPGPANVRCYSFDELFAEKIRAMAQRCRPRDLYDIVNLYRHRDLHPEPVLVREALVAKCEAKGVDFPSVGSLESTGLADELRAEWSNMLEHQLPALPPVDDFWNELPHLFDWLDGTDVAQLATAPVVGAVEIGWTPPPTITTWRTGVPLETVRFAAANRLCVELGYQGSRRLIEPYSLRRTLDGNLLLAAVKARTGEVRTYRVDRIESVRVTTQPFRPRYAIEFAAAGPLSVQPTARTYGSTTSFGSPRSRSRSSSARYTVECSWCGKRFPRTRYSTRLNPHKDKHGYPCASRHGYMV